MNPIQIRTDEQEVGNVVKAVFRDARHRKLTLSSRDVSMALRLVQSNRMNPK
jgi:hypothetical protein